MSDTVAALLSWVTGHPLSGESDTEQVGMARTLTVAHAALLSHHVPEAPSWHWLDPAAPHLSPHSWLAPAIASAVSAVNAIDGRLTFGVVHGDPAPEAFIRDPGNGRTGLIDWSAVTRGPLLYDVATAVMYLGGQTAAVPFIEAYAAAELVDRTELDEHLSALLRFRWAVQGDYFARRLAITDQTGICGDEGNHKGLADAQRALCGG